MELINEKIIHKLWGNGFIKSFNGESIIVVFDKNGEKKLAYPVAIDQGFIKILDSEKQELVELEIAKLAKKDSIENTSKSKELLEKDHLLEVSATINRSNMSLDDRSISGLKINNIYSNNDLREIFKVSNQGGMRKSNATNSLVLISKHSNDPERNPYEDKWEKDGLFHYTGMGLRGNQDLNYMQNRTLNNSNFNNVNVYLFESYSSNEYIFKGKVVLAKEPYAIDEYDRDGRIRKVYKFPLKVLED